MRYKLPEIALAVAALALPACGGGGGGYSAPGGGGGGGGGGVIVPPGVGALTIGLALPSGTIGVENDPVIGTVAGFTQAVYSQTLGFAPGTQVTIRNLSSTTPHTLNVLSTTSFPANPALSTGPSGTAGTLNANFASGTIAAGGSIGPVTLTAGTYYLGCAYHYIPAAGVASMRTALMVAAAATPGPQATPQPSVGGGGGGCVGGYC